MTGDRSGGRRRRAWWLRSAAGTALALALAALTAVPASATLPAFGAGPMTAIFTQPSYAPGQIARLTLTADASRITVQPLTALPSPHAGHPWAAFARVAGDAPVGPARTLAWQSGTGTVGVRVGQWPSGVYFVRVRSAQGTVVAPLIVRAAHPERDRVLVVIPTYSWEAYDGRGGDTWYDCSCVSTVNLNRPYLYGGVPYNFGQYDRGLLLWLSREHARADVVSDQDYAQTATGTALRRRFRMIIFDGHSEYATAHMFAITQQYRDAGGHLLFLSANDFFREVTVTGSSMTLIAPFRDLGLPEAALEGAQYLDWFRDKYANRPYVVTGQQHVPWLFAGTGLHDGDTIDGEFGIEIDALAPASPPQTKVIAQIPDIFPGETAQMTYYTTPGGAEVFDAGAINFGGAAHLPEVGAMIGNLWCHMTGAAASPGTACPA